MKTKNMMLPALALAAVVLWTAVFAASGLVSRTPTPYYKVQQDAYQRMERAMEAVRGYKKERGIPMSPLDLRETGLIGAEYNGITTTLGALEAKRTAADPNMAALVVRMFYEAGLEPGDRVGAGFSGSFPSLNIAVLCACDAMGLSVTYISSVGASTYGANDPELTFPEMAHLLYADGLVSTDSALVTWGGDYDTGVGMDPALMAAVEDRLEGFGLELLVEPEFTKNLEARRAVYDRTGIDCFTAVGGNTTSLGLSESAASIGQGVLTDPLSTGRLDERSGLVQWYLAQGLPVVHLLNIKQIVADYGMPFDPLDTAPAGESPVFYRSRYPRLLVGGALAGAALLGTAVWYGRKKGSDPGIDCIV